MINFEDFRAVSPILDLGEAMFSLAESEDYYVVVVDIPAIPTSATEIQTEIGRLSVVGHNDGVERPQTIFRLMSKSGSIKTVYMNGMLYLLLPKAEPVTKHSEIVTA